MFSLKLFGGASIESDGAPVVGPVAQRRRLACLALLAISARGAMSREKLAAYLFPEYDTERAHGALGDALHALRKALGKEAILSVGDELRLNSDVIRSDVADFEAALARGEREVATALYAGPFLDGFFVPEAPELNRWVEVERARLARAYARALEEVASEREAREDFTGAAEIWHRVVALDPYSARTTTCLMRALAAAGDRAAAIRHAHVYSRLVQGELGIDPDPEVEALSAQFRTEPAAGRGDAPAMNKGAPAAGERTGPKELLAPESGSSTFVPPEEGTEPVAVAESGPSAPEPQGSAERVTRAAAWAGWHPRWRWAGGIGLVVLILIALGIRSSSRPPIGAGVREPPILSLAVLPLANLSGDPSQEYFADGMTDELITELARIGSIRVISRTSVMSYKQTRKPLPEIARELGVDAVVEGSVRRAGDRVRITAQLIRARDDAHLWAQTYERDLKDILGLHREVALAIAGGVRGTLMPGERAGAAAPVRPLVPEAYDPYLRGKLYRRRVSETDIENAVVLLEEAVSIDPTFAAGYGELALAYAYLYSIFQSGEAELAEKALLAAEKALSLEPGQPEAHLARGRVLWTPTNGFPHDGAIREFQRALARDPNSDEAHFQLGQVYFHVGLLEESLAEFRASLAVNPVDPRPRVGIGQALLFQMQPAEALSALRQTPEDYNPPTRGPHLAWALLLLGRKAEAAAALENAFTKAPEDRNGTFAAMQAVLAAADGDREQAQEKIRLAATKQRGSIHFHHAEYNIGTAYALMSQPDSAMKWLRAAAENGFPCYPLFAGDPSLQPLRSDPRFARLLRELRTQWEGYAAMFGANAAVTTSGQ